MIETIKEFFSQPEVTALITSILSVISANLLTIILFAVKYIKLKNTEIKNKLQSEEVISQLTAEYNAKISEFASKIDISLANIESTVIKKINDKDALRQEEIEKETILLQQAIEETKKQLEQ